MFRVVSGYAVKFRRSLSRPITMSQVHKRKSIASDDLEALTQESPAGGTQGPPTPAQGEPVPASIRRSRRAAVSAVLTAAEFADEPRPPQSDSTDGANVAPAGKVAGQRRRKATGMDAKTADEPEPGSLAPAPSVVVAVTVRRRRRKAAAAPTDTALSVEPDPGAEPEVAIPVKRVRRKKTAEADMPEVPVIIQHSATAALSGNEAATPKKQRAARRRAAAAVPAPVDAAAVVDAPPLPALTVERMPEAIAHLSAADPGAASRLPYANCAVLQSCTRNAL